MDKLSFVSHSTIGEPYCGAAEMFSYLWLSLPAEVPESGNNVNSDQHLFAGGHKTALYSVVRERFVHRADGGKRLAGEVP